MSRLLLVLLLALTGCALVAGDDRENQGGIGEEPDSGGSPGEVDCDDAVDDDGDGDTDCDDGDCAGVDGCP